MSPLPRKSPSRRSHCSVSSSRCVTAWIPMPLKTNLLISLHNLINAKESVWNHPAHSWLFCVSVISTTHTVTAVDTLRLSLPNNLLALMGQDPAPSSPAHLSPCPKPPWALLFPSYTSFLLAWALWCELKLEPFYPWKPSFGLLNFMVYAHSMCGNIIIFESVTDQTWLKSAKGLRSYYREDKEGPRQTHKQHDGNKLHFLRKPGKKLLFHWV